ncbi:MAG TPA: DUF1638 domain-containing protein [Verrucomicrobiota bacterium]|nr:DUF1638 domain-containing protein [Verrucomicrobiota bacterium]
MRLKAICCEMYSRAFLTAMARSTNKIDPEFVKLDGSIHTEELRDKIQSIIDNLNHSEYSAVLLLIGCENGLNVLNGLVAKNIPVVLPKKIGCDQLLFANKEGSISKRLQEDYELLANSCDVLMENQDLEHSKQNGFKFQEKIDLFDETSLALWEKETETEAQWFGWDFEKITDNYQILQRLVDGYWSYDEFYVLMPGSQFNAEVDTTDTFKVNT